LKFFFDSLLFLLFESPTQNTTLCVASSMVFDKRKSVYNKKKKDPERRREWEKSHHHLKCPFCELCGKNNKWMIITNFSFLLVSLYIPPSTFNYEARKRRARAQKKKTFMLLSLFIIDGVIRNSQSKSQMKNWTTTFIQIKFFFTLLLRLFRFQLFTFKTGELRRELAKIKISLNITSFMVVSSFRIRYFRCFSFFHQLFFLGLIFYSFIFCIFCRFFRVFSRLIDEMKCKKWLVWMTQMISIFFDIQHETFFFLLFHRAKNTNFWVR
jgi:hypothetical protein